MEPDHDIHPDALDFDERRQLLDPGERFELTSSALAPKNPLEGAALHQGQGDLRHGESYDNVPRVKRQLGLFSAVFLIFNKVIGTGIYATPSVILRSSGSVGVALIMWLLGALVAAAGTTVYIELGTGMPRSGGEKNYLEFIYRRPRFLATCAYAVYAIITNNSAANCVVFGEYVIHSLSLAPSRYNTRFVAFLCLSFVLIMHGIFLKTGLRIQNALGLFKLLVLSAIALSGIFCLIGLPGFTLQDGYEAPRNFEWDRMWEGSGTGANAFVTGLYNVMWSFSGYSGMNYALSEVRDPIRTIKRAAPLALLLVAASYMLVNVAYFAVISKSDILGSHRIIAALFFRNLFGPTMEKALSVVISLSMLGNILAGQFVRGRVVQELGREGILPFSSFFASNKPFNAPLSGLFTQYVVTSAFIFGTPPGDAYLFLLSVSSYSQAIINTLVSGGLLLLYTPAYRIWDWEPPFSAPKLIILSFFLSNIFLVVVPVIPPASGSGVYNYLPYWLHVLVSASASLIGVTYWYVWCVWLPRRKGYRLEREWVLQDDGVSRYIFQKISIE